MIFISHPLTGLSIGLTAGLLVVHSSAKDLGIKFPSVPNGLDLPTAKSIYNAWMETAIIDNYGMVWVLQKRLSDILRTSKANARYIADKIPDKYKSRGAAGTYFHYAELNKQLSHIIMAAGSTRREKYAGFSESIGIAIRDSDKAKLQRAETYAATSTARRQLKRNRINWYSIKHDELTGIPLLLPASFPTLGAAPFIPN